MFKLMRRNRKGFTLIELIVVIAILAILAAIAIPTFSGITDSANERVALANARSIATGINAFNALQTLQNNMLTSKGTAAEAAAKIGNLWPSGLGDGEDEAWTLVRISTDGVATVEAGASPSPT